MSFIHVASGLNSIVLMLYSLTTQPISEVRKAMSRPLRIWKRKNSIVDDRACLQAANNHLIGREKKNVRIFNKSNDHTLYVGKCNYLLNFYFNLLEVLDEHFYGNAHQHPSRPYIWKYYMFLPRALRVWQINGWIQKWTQLFTI